MLFCRACPALAVCARGRQWICGVQTETPEQLKAFNETAGKGGKRKVVRRQPVVVLSQGILTEPTMLSASPHATFVATAVELPGAEGDCSVRIGVCAVEAAQGRVLMGEFCDGPLRASLQRCFSGAPPPPARCCS